jgi:hypothetical protein
MMDNDKRVAEFAKWLVTLSADDADFAMTSAQDILSEDGNGMAGILLDGMRAGVQQAREAHHNRRVVVIWFDGWGSRSIFSWDGDGCINPEYHQEIASALNSALQANCDEA